VRLLQKFLNNKRALAPGVVAISFTPSGTAIAIMDYSGLNRPRLLHCEFLGGDEQDINARLEHLVQEFKLDSYDCHIVLSSKQYRAVSLEAPQVDAQEMKQALRWRMVDFLDYPVDQAVLDFFPLPKSNRPNAATMMEVAACAQNIIHDLVQRCRQLRLNVKVIDIEETALRNLAYLLRENQQGVALLHLDRDEGRIIIQKNGEILLIRNITTGYSHLDENAPYNDQERVTMEQDSLALDIQRSFDYVENFYDIPPITTLAAVLMPINVQNTVNFLNIRHGISSYAMDISAVVDSDIMISDELQNVCSAVIGAGLRRFMEVGEA
jgi:MSHA biogenesis protein MshI